jgi:hypothetical protein
MPSDSNNNQDSSSGSGRRRSSFVDLFASRPVNPQPNAPRRLSITTMGLSTANNQSTPYSALRSRTESISSAGSNMVDESPFEDEPTNTFSPTTTTTSPFARRMSFGAKALNGNPRTAAGASSPQNGQNGTARPSIASTTSAQKGSTSSPKSHSRGLSCSAHDVYCLETHSFVPRQNSSMSPPLSPKSRANISIEGFDFAENMRQRAERGSLSGAPSNFGQAAQSPSHQRSKSIASVEAPPRELPKQQRPDAFQERILKGDFYMD